MSTNKSSTFLAILKNYAPNYEPRENQNEQKKDQKKIPKKSQTQPAPKKIDPPPQQENIPPPIKKKLPRDRQQSAIDREGTDIGNSRPDEEKCLKSYENWQMIKRDLKEEDTERLKQKIFLQLQLIRAQEQLYQQKVQEQEDEKAKKRSEERALKHATAERLLEQCKKSLAEDRQNAAKLNRRNRAKSTATSFTIGTNVGTGDGLSEGKKSKTPHSPDKQDPPQRMPTQTLLDDSEDERDTMSAVPPNMYDKHRREGTDVSSVASLTPQPTPGKMSPVVREITTNITREMTRASTLPEEDEDEEEEEEEEFDEFAEYPWYQQKLYRLYGRTKADYFLHPKIEAKTKKNTKKLDPKFKNPDGRTGANELWTNLRKESKGKLHKVDATIPDELKAHIVEYRNRCLKNKKSAFSCFAREGVAKLRKPIRRSYAIKDDVPEMDRLLDQSIVQDAQNYRHKMELMYRSSQKNEDRFSVLTFNNPFPNLNNMTGEESVARYMPSWIDEVMDDESEMSYKKWLENEKESMTSSRLKGGVDESEDKIELPLIKPDPSKGGVGKGNVYDSGSDVLPSEWDFTLVKKANLGQDKGPKYVFLTERDARTPGQFRKRRAEALAAKAFPAAYQPKDGTQSAMASYGGQDEPSALVNPSTYRSGRSAYAVSTEFTLSGGEEPRSHSTEVYTRDFPTWEPLSMNALVEYKEKIGILGSGDFAQGKAQTWHLPATSVK